MPRLYGAVYRRRHAIGLNGSAEALGSTGSLGGLCYSIRLDNTIARGFSASQRADPDVLVKTSKLPEALKAAPWELIAEAYLEGAVETFGEYGSSRLIRSEPCTLSERPCITFMAEANPEGFPRTWMVMKVIYMGDGTIGIVHSAPAEGFNQARADEYLATFKLLQAEAKRSDR